MFQQGYSKESILRTSLLVKNHEVGGDKDTNFLMDADSISYFDTNIDWYYKEKGLEKTKSKIIFMYRRASLRAKKIIKSLCFKNEDVQTIFEKMLVKHLLD